MKSINIAVVQMNAKINNIEENLAKITEFVYQAKQRNVSIICFPELSICGYSQQRAPQAAELIPGTSSQYLSELAQKEKISILAGLAEKNYAGKPYITQLIAFADGRIGKYRKTHLGNMEKKHFSPGDNLPTFDTGSLQFGIQLCWEMHFPEISTVLAINGSKLIFAPHASPVSGTERKDIWIKYLLARAYDNSVYVAACNLVGFDGEKQEFGGGTIIIDPKGNVVREVFNKNEELVMAQLDLELINTIRTKRGETMRNSFYLNARRPELYHDIIREV